MEQGQPAPCPQHTMHPALLLRPLRGPGKGRSEQTLAGEAGFSRNKHQRLPTQGQSAGAASSVSHPPTAVSLSSACRGREQTSRSPASATPRPRDLPQGGCGDKRFPCPTSLSKTPPPLSPRQLCTICQPLGRQLFPLSLNPSSPAPRASPERRPGSFSNCFWVFSNATRRLTPHFYRHTPSTCLP